MTDVVAGLDIDEALAGFETAPARASIVVDAERLRTSLRGLSATALTGDECFSLWTLLRTLREALAITDRAALAREDAVALGELVRVTAVESYSGADRAALSALAFTLQHDVLPQARRAAEAHQRAAREADRDR